MQQDKAKLHISVDDLIFVRETQNFGGNILRTCQPPIFLDFNVLDLGYFNSIQNLLQRSYSKINLKPVSTVQKSFNGLFLNILNKTFLWIRKALETSLSVYDGNDYNLSHSNYNGSNAPQMSRFNQSCDAQLFLNA